MYHNKKTDSHPTAGMAVSIHQFVAIESIGVGLAAGLRRVYVQDSFELIKQFQEAD